MKIDVRYSLFEEIKESIHILFHKADYQNLRSVVQPSISGIFKYYIHSDRTRSKINTLWINNSENINKAFVKYGLKDLGLVSCYLHGISCEGWFDIDTNSIHIRATRSDGNEEILDTIIHELLHLATYKEDLSYEEREKIVDKFLRLFTATKY